MSSSSIHASARRWWIPVLVICLYGGYTYSEPLNSKLSRSSRSLRAKAQSSSTQEQKPATPRKDLGLLNLSRSSQQEMEGGDVHVYHVPLKQGQYLRVIAEQEDIDVVVSLYEPLKEKALISMDSPNGTHGREAVSIVAAVSGDYILEIRADERGAMAGRYEVSSEGPREPTTADLKRVAAVEAFLEGARLRRPGKADTRPQAIEKYKEALAEWRSLGDSYEVGVTLLSLGSVYRSLPDLAQAREHYNQALAVWQTDKNLYGQAMALNETGAAIRDLDSPQNALPFYQAAYKLYEEAKNQWGKAQQLNNIGFIYALQGRQREALEEYRRALSLWQAVQDRNMEANALNNMGGAFERLGDLSQALTNYQMAIRLWQDTGNSTRLGIAYNNVAVIYHSFGDSQAALDNYGQALSLSRELKNERSEATALSNIGMVYADWGELQRAQEYLNQSLQLRQKLKESRGQGQTLDNIGYVNFLLDNYQEALNKYQEALPLLRQSQDKQRLASTLTHLGMVHNALGDQQKALDFYQQALQIQKESESKLGQAVTLDKMGHAYVALSDFVKAAGYLNEALALWNEVGDPQGKAMSLYGLALMENARGKLLEARGFIEQAVGIIENLRGKTSSEQLRTTYLATKHNYYELDIDIKMRLAESNPSGGYLEAALEASERARARSLLDILSEGRVDIRQGGDAKLISQKNELEKKLGAISGRLLLLRGVKPRPESAARVAREVETLTQEFETLSNQHEDVQARIRAKSPRYAQLTQPQSLALSDIRALLDDDTLLLEYALGEKSSYLWAVTRSGVSGYKLPGRKEIEQAANNLRELLTMYESSRPGESNIDYGLRLKASLAEYRQQASELGRIVLGPVAGRLGTKRLVIVADGRLQFIPFESLIMPGATEEKSVPANSTVASHDTNDVSLALKNEVAYLSSASTLALVRSVRRRQATKSVAVIADPVFNSNDKRVLANTRKATPGAPAQTRQDESSKSLRDSGITDGGFKLDPLPYSLEEAAGIISVIPTGSGMQAVGFSANRATATDPSIGDYRIVHFATHAILNDRHPQFSALVLSLIDERGQPQDGFLWLQDIYNLNLPVDLVVLSACRTGIGKEGRGEGFMGLTRGFFYAGASKVIASLWKVDDEATAALMKNFYRHLLKEHLPIASALRLAKIDVMQARDQWRAPYYWAGFVLHGDWK